eukprot:CAMPEP_0168525222 /NCGR_PEP_ID=MMETSP0405-20121227/11165_1 /TAXON_ID=498012 /ORGANISM="Trichosphaerium sp, Strain Am-I-7 wt" /LENGTH=346 /DNA_ID=CAMNT_0008547675 /DNA_START=112 /DNA_END=1152 /DNA_ORIENTATION=+
MTDEDGLPKAAKPMFLDAKTHTASMTQVTNMNRQEAKNRNLDMLHRIYPSLTSKGKQKQNTEESNFDGCEDKFIRDAVALHLALHRFQGVAQDALAAFTEAVTEAVTDFIMKMGAGMHRMTDNPNLAPQKPNHILSCIVAEMCGSGAQNSNTSGLNALKHYVASTITRGNKLLAIDAEDSQKFLVACRADPRKVDALAHRTHPNFSYTVPFVKREENETTVATQESKKNYSKLNTQFSAAKGGQDAQGHLRYTTRSSTAVVKTASNKRSRAKAKVDEKDEEYLIDQPTRTKRTRSSRSKRRAASQNNFSSYSFEEDPPYKEGEERIEETTKGKRKRTTRRTSSRKL